MSKVNLRTGKPGLFQEKFREVRDKTTKGLKYYSDGLVIRIEPELELLSSLGHTVDIRTESTLIKRSVIDMDSQSLSELSSLDDETKTVAAGNIATVRAFDDDAPSLAQFYTSNENREVGRSRGYAIFPELESGEQVTIDAIENAFIKRGILNQQLQKTLLDLILQSRVCLPWGCIYSITSTLAENKLSVFGGSADANKPPDSLHVDVVDANHIRLIISNDFAARVVIDPKTKEEKTEKIGQLDTIVEIKPNSVYLSSMMYTKVGKTKEAEKAYTIINNNKEGIFSRMWRSVKKYFGFKETDDRTDIIDPIFELAPERQPVERPADKKTKVEVSATDSAFDSNEVEMPVDPDETVFNKTSSKKP